MKLEVKDIKKSFGEKKILHGISFEMVSGRAMGFLGRNGAGKSTTIRCLMDVFRQDSGQFLLDGQPFRPWQMRIGYLPEERGMYQKNDVLGQLTYFAMLRGANRADAARSAHYWIDYFGLGDFKKKKLETLSKGNQQKIQIAQSFLNEPDILILDEPFSGLDPVNAQVFKDTIAQFVKEGKLVIFSSHQMSYVEEVCDDVTLIHEGNILLTGDLKQIKLAEGRDKLHITPMNGSLGALQDKLAAAFPTLLITQDRGSLIVDTQGKDMQSELLSWFAQEGTALRRFGLYEPSLADIFIQKVGETA